MEEITPRGSVVVTSSGVTEHEGPPEIFPLGEIPPYADPLVIWRTQRVVRNAPSVEKIRSDLREWAESIKVEQEYATRARLPWWRRYFGIWVTKPPPKPVSRQEEIQVRRAARQAGKPVRTPTAVARANHAVRAHCKHPLRVAGLCRNCPRSV